MVVGRDRVYLLPLASELKKRERLTRLVRKAGAGEPLASRIQSHGGGVLSHAIHPGRQDAGVECELVFANELRDDLLAQAIEHNDAWKGGEVLLRTTLPSATWTSKRSPGAKPARIA